VFLYVSQWWEAELERPYLLYRAKRLRDTLRKHQEAIGASVPAYLETRGAVGPAVPVVEVFTPQQRWYSLGRKAPAEAVEEERHEMLVHVLENLNDQLFIELMAFMGRRVEYGRRYLEGWRDAHPRQQYNLDRY
jgi:hypothetical protein